MYAMYERPNTYGYTFWNLEAASLNPSLQNLQLSQSNLYHAALNRSYDAHLNASQLNLNSHINNTNQINSATGQASRYFGMPGYFANIGHSKRYSNYEYQLNDYAYTSNLNRVTFGERPMTWVGGDGSAQKRINRNFKVYMFETNEEGESVGTGEVVISSNDQDNDDLESDYDTFEEYNK